MAIIVPTNPIHFINWRYLSCISCRFWYLGHCFSYLNGYYRHYGANPDKPIAWGVSSYGKMYNWLFFYNGYHAEHHFRPKVHWTKMEQFHRSIEAPAGAGRRPHDQARAHVWFSRSRFAKTRSSRARGGSDRSSSIARGRFGEPP